MKLSEVFLKNVGVDICLEHNISVYNEIISSEGIISYLDNKIDTFPEVIDDFRKLRAGDNVNRVLQSMLDAYKTEKRNRLDYLKRIAEKNNITIKV